MIRFTPLRIIALFAIILGFTGVRHCNYLDEQHRKILEAERQADRPIIDRLDHEPRYIDIMVSFSDANFSTRAEAPSVKRRLSKISPVPAILSLPGCGFPTSGKDVPRAVPVLSVYENPVLSKQLTVPEACVTRDGRKIEEALRRELNFLIDRVSNYPWIDQRRLLLIGSGEAAPIVAQYNGRPGIRRIAWGDPCLVAWGKGSDTTPMTVLQSKKPLGLEALPSRKIYIAALGHWYNNGPPPTQGCAALSRPNFSSKVRLIRADVKHSHMSMKLFEAQRAEYEALIS